MKKIFFFTVLFIMGSIIHAYPQNSLFGSRGGNQANNNNTPAPPSLTNPIGTLLLEENMDDVTLLTGMGWVFEDVDGPGTSTFFQGNSTVFSSYNGAASSYFGQNFNGAFEGGLLIDQWLISPAITSYGPTSFSFWTRAAGGTWNDHIYIYYSPTGSSNLSDFVLLMDRTQIPSTWTQYSQTITANGPVRFAIRYYETNGGPSGSDSNYFGIDAVQIYGSTEPLPVSITIWWIFALFVAIGAFTVYKFKLRRA